MSAGGEFRHIVRIAGLDVDGTLKVVHGLALIRGVGLNLARIILRTAGIDPNMRVGYLTDQNVKKIEEVLADPLKHGIPSWVLNRQRDPQTGDDLHLIGADWEFAVKSDIDFMKKIKCWRGLRHAWGLKVRGQRTRTTGRKGRTIGVARKPK
ncbi:MAG: 30S ribosomal protein S13 [Thermoprotei archaeon]|nr:MAG: 30S ribosomal protein S13 [Thermoprotei archaeon]RLF17652.1 MAG: 30S ribosomal protein S13 [Thermoprotei archaeon]